MQCMQKLKNKFLERLPKKSVIVYEKDFEQLCANFDKKSLTLQHYYKSFFIQCITN